MFLTSVWNKKFPKCKEKNHKVIDIHRKYAETAKKGVDKKKGHGIHAVPLYAIRNARYTIRLSPFRRLYLYYLAPVFFREYEY